MCCCCCCFARRRQQVFTLAQVCKRQICVCALWQQQQANIAELSSERERDEKGKKLHSIRWETKSDQELWAWRPKRYKKLVAARVSSRLLFVPTLALSLSSSSSSLFKAAATATTITTTPTLTSSKRHLTAWMATGCLSYLCPQLRANKQQLWKDRSREKSAHFSLNHKNTANLKLFEPISASTHTTIAVDAGNKSLFCMFAWEKKRKKTCSMCVCVLCVIDT